MKSEMSYWYQYELVHEKWESRRNCGERTIYIEQVIDEDEIAFWHVAYVTRNNIILRILYHLDKVTGVVTCSKVKIAEF